MTNISDSCTKEKLREELRQNTVNLTGAIDLFTRQNNRLEKYLKTDWDFLKYIDEGRLLVLGGASGIGKTALMLQIMYELALNNTDTICIYANAEMMTEELTMRLITNQVDEFNMSNIRKEFKTKNKNYKANVEKAKFLLELKNFFFLNANRFTLKNLIEMIKLAREKNTDKRIFVAIDYLQLLLISQSSLNDINLILKELKDVLIETRATAFCISALNREALKNNIVDTTAFRDSSAIEYTSDIAMLMCFQKISKQGNKYFVLKENDNEKENDIINFNLLSVKNRIGKFFNYELKFDKLNQKISFRINEEDTIDDFEEEETEEFTSVYDII